MKNEKRLIDANEAEIVKKTLVMCYKQGITSECTGCVYKAHNGVCMDALMEDALALINGLESCIDAQPTVDAVEVVHGRWEEWWCDNYLQYFHKCSACGVDAPTKEGTMYDEVLSKYCPNCGAKMDGDGNDADY